MKIAMFTNNYFPNVSGISISIERLATSLRQLGHRVYLFAPSYSEKEHNEDHPDVIRYHSLFKHGSTGVAVPNHLDPKIEKILSKLAVDVIHTHHPLLVGKTAISLGRKYRIPVVFTHHTRYQEYVYYLTPTYVFSKRQRESEGGNPTAFGKYLLNVVKNKVIPFFLRQYTNQCNRVIVPSKAIKEELVTNQIEPAIQILATGLPDNSYLVNPLERDVLRLIHGKGCKRVFLTVSRLGKEKNIEFLLYSFKRYLEEYQGDACLLIIGKGPDRARLEKLVESLQLSQQISFLGEIANHLLPNYYAMADAFLYASKSETQGIVILEAMAVKTPVIALKASGVEDILKNGINGYETRESIPQYSRQMADCFGDLYNYQQLRQGAYDTALRYSCELIAKKTIAIYQETKEKADESWPKPVRKRLIIS